MPPKLGCTMPGCKNYFFVKGYRIAGYALRITLLVKKREGV